MKIFFASLTDPTIEVDAWVPTHSQGLVLLHALNQLHVGHDVIMRARLKLYENYEERFVGRTFSRRFDEFISEVEAMGNKEPKTY
jgi:hypothetical protein